MIENDTEVAMARQIAERLTHTPENTEHLVFYGFEPLKDPMEYCY